MERKEFKTKDGYKVLYESYESPVELVNLLDTRESNWYHDDDPDWQGCSRTEARDLLTYGIRNNVMLNKAKEELDKCTKLLVKNKKRKQNSVCGYRVNVPRYVQGNPNNMVRRVKRESKDKIIEVLIDTTYAAYVTPEQASSYFIKVVARINQLEMNGYRVKISICNTYTSDGKSEKSHVMKVLLKRENQPLNLRRMLFMVAHTGMFRCIGFEWYEKLPGADRLGGYGTALCYKSEERQKNTVAEISDANKSYYISYGKDLDKTFADIAL